MTTPARPVSTPEHPLAVPQSSPALRAALDAAAKAEQGKQGKLFRVTGGGLKPVKP